MSYIIPAWELTIEARREFRKRAYEVAMHRASQVLGAPVDALIVRELIASCLGLKFWRTPAQKVGELTTWINYKLPIHQFISIYKIIQLSQTPKVTLTRFGKATSVLGYHEVDSLYSILPIIKKINQLGRRWPEVFGGLEHMIMEGYFSEPYFFEGGDIVNIQVQSFSDNKTGDRLKLAGFVIEPHGMEIT